VLCCSFQLIVCLMMRPACVQVHAALLSSSDVNQGMAAALAEAFKQLSGLDSGADDVAALTAWYTSTFRAPGPGSTQQQAPASQQQVVAAEAPATAKATGRQLRARAPAAAAPAAGQQAAGGEGPEVAPLPAAPQPLVIMLQGAEQCDVAALRALVLALSQVSLACSTPPHTDILPCGDPLLLSSAMLLSRNVCRLHAAPGSACTRCTLFQPDPPPPVTGSWLPACVPPAGGVHLLPAVQAVPASGPAGSAGPSRGQDAPRSGPPAGELHGTALACAGITAQQ
jgi:hypothetical protein